jgi:hypothetical protein
MILGSSRPTLPAGGWSGSLSLPLAGGSANEPASTGPWIGWPRSKGKTRTMLVKSTFPGTSCATTAERMPTRTRRLLPTAVVSPREEDADVDHRHFPRDLQRWTGPC